MEYQEQRIVNQLRLGDKKAFESLFFGYYPKLSVFARKYVTDLDTAKEIVQNYFVDLYEKREQLDIQTSLNNYLYSSVRNRCLNYLHQQKLHSDHKEQLKLFIEESENDLFQKIEATELEYKIWEEVSGLPEQCKIIFKLSRKEGLKNKEIATRLEISIRTVETQISKALKVLRKNLKQYLKIFFF